MQQGQDTFDVDRSAGDFKYAEDYAYDAGVGLNEDVVRYISKVKGEDEWVLNFRLSALKAFEKMPNPTHWAPKKLDELDFSKIRYYLAKSQQKKRSWDEVPDDVKQTFERLGVPEQERAFLAGVDAQFDSESAYTNMKEHLAKDGVIFCDSTEGMRRYPEFFKKYFGKVIPISDSKYSALNSAVFSGGSFVYVPKGVKLKQPLQAYFRINAESFGQFERTLIIADEGAELMYMEGCTAPRFETGTLHSGVVELVALKGAKIQYVTVQNWSDNVFNLVTQRGMAEEDAQIRWVDCNIGSGITMKYPAVILKGARARGEVVSIALATTKQHQDTGAKMIHLASGTTSNITSKSVSIGSGRASYRGLVYMAKNTSGCKNNTVCDALLINANSRTDTYPAVVCGGENNSVQHEASVSKINEEQIFYMRQRGLSEQEAVSLSVNGFVNDLVKEFPMEYSVELRRLIDLQMEGSVG